MYIFSSFLFRSLNLGVAEQDATRKQSEGVSGAKVELARAERAAIDVVAEALSSSGSSQTEYMLSQRYVDVFRSMSARAGQQLIYLPYEIGMMSGIIKKLPGVFGVGVKAPKVTKVQKRVTLGASPAETKTSGEEFDELS